MRGQGRKTSEGAVREMLAREVVARGSGSGMGRGGQIQRGTLWHLMQLDREDQRITSVASARLAHSSSSFMKPGSLSGETGFLLTKGFLSSNRIACVLGYRLPFAAYLPLTPQTLLSVLTSDWVWPVGIQQKTGGQGKKVTVFNPHCFPVRRSRLATPSVSLKTTFPSLSNCSPSRFQYPLPALRLGPVVVTAALTTSRITPTALWFPNASPTPL